ncbi:flagellar export protein FliJ [Geodermatophilus telluris]|uniref:Flagellar FliJ protein n=1 Tax=Geodermatophilus telluris TaxID=1190417 RepID=A0A1G6M7U4_9ACTN|nr:flagellar export protein FliJ [Geodermatophilus telluris]SDC51384.1 flagellar export protein FliJ [Geodermatophilus telluris]
MGRPAAFRLEPVLKVRRAAEQAAERAAAEAAAAAREAERRADEQAAALAARVPPASAPAHVFLAAMVSSAAAAADVRAARATAQASAEHAGLLRARWTAAAQETRALEKLRERHLLALRAAEASAEERAVDDLVTRRHAVRTGGNGEEEPWTG